MLSCDLMLFRRVIPENKKQKTNKQGQNYFLSNSQIKGLLSSGQLFNATGSLDSPLGPGNSHLPAGSGQPARGRTTATKSTDVPLIPAAAG